MKARDVVRMGSCRALVALLEEAETSAVPGVTRARTAFIIEIKKAEELESLQAEDLSLAHRLRDAAFQKMETVVLRVCGRASSYAVETGSQDMIARCRLEVRKLTHGAFVKRLLYARQMHRSIVEMLPELADAEINAADVAELAEALAEAESQMVAPRMKLGRRMDATAELTRQFSRLSQFVRLRLDPLFRPLRRTNPGLYLRYRVARKQLRRSPASTGEAEAPATAAATVAAPAPAGLPLAA